MRKFKVTLIREDPSLEPYVFIVEAEDEAAAVLLVCNEHADLPDVEAIQCEEIFY